jgi:hypothetical protein
VVLAILADRELAGTVTNTRLAVRKLRDGAVSLELPFAAKSIEVGTDPDGDPITRVVIGWHQQTIKPADADWSKSLRLLRQVLMTVMADHGVDATPFLDGPVVRAVDVKLVRTNSIDSTRPTETSGRRQPRVGRPSTVPSKTRRRKGWSRHAKSKASN